MPRRKTAAIRPKGPLLPSAGVEWEKTAGSAFVEGDWRNFVPLVVEFIRSERHLRCGQRMKLAILSDMKKCGAEMIGTFALVFAGTGAIVINEATGGAVSHVGIALTFGLIVLAMIYTVGDISGAHLNPAVTIGFWAARRLPGRDVFPYIGSQLTGALLASGLLRSLFPENKLLGATLPAGSEGQSLVLEIVLTFFLMLTILNVSTGAKEKGITAGIAVGAVIALEAMFAGPISGASMNPARSLAPAILSGHFEHMWIYLAAPPAGACAAMLACRCVREDGCCMKPQNAL